MKIYKALAKIQQELKVPKGQRNSFGNYNYRSCEDILGAVKPLLKDYSLIVSDEVCLIGDRTYVKATATISDGTEMISADGYARESEIKKGMDLSQITGSTSSYARKYALNGLFALDDNKDADTDENFKQAKKPMVKPKTTKVIQVKPTTIKLITSGQQRLVRKLASESDTNVSSIKTHYKVKSSKELTMSQASEIIEKLKDPKCMFYHTQEDLGLA